MDFDILDMLNEATKEADAFEAHPARELSLEERLLYLNGLAIVMNADGNIDEEEKEYIRILIKSFEMDEGTLASFVEFAQAPDKDTIQAFFRTFRRKPIAQLFLFDALMMTRRDGKVEDKEVAVVNKIADQLEILKGTQQDIFDLFCHIKNRNWQESALYFSSHLLNPEHFKHLLDYHEVDFDELMEETRDIRQNRLGDILKSKINLEQYTWGKLSTDYFTDGIEREVTEELVKLEFHYSIMLPFLQSKLDSQEWRINKVLECVDTASDSVLFSLNSLNINYCQESSFVFLPSDIDENSIINWPTEMVEELCGISDLASEVEKLEKAYRFLGVEPVLPYFRDSRLVLLKEMSTLQPIEKKGVKLFITKVEDKFKAFGTLLVGWQGDGDWTLGRVAQTGDEVSTSNRSNKELCDYQSGFVREDKRIQDLFITANDLFSYGVNVCR